MYNICHAKTYNINKLVTVHLCCSHFMHMVSRDVSQLNVTKVMRKRILMIMASLINTTSYEEFKQKVCNRMIIFKSKRITNTVKKAVEDIDKEENIMEIPGNKPLDDSAIPINLPIYKSSKFYADGKEIQHSVNDIIMKESNIFADENPCYCEQFCKLFLDRYMPFTPLWTGKVIKHSPSDKNNTTRFSNSIIENWFNMIKGSVLECQTGLKVG